jgi:hypothetical protein
MKDIAWITNAQSAWKRLWRFVSVLEEAMDADIVAPLYRRVTLLERKIEELRSKLPTEDTAS